jgi:3-dehydroquinate dehydratase I
MKKRTAKSPEGLQDFLSTTRPLIVGTVHDAAGVRMVQKVQDQGAGRGIKSALGGIDLLEVRLDAVGTLRLPKTWPLRVISTARHPGEGGVGKLSVMKRRVLLEDALEWSSALDIELRSVRDLSPTVALTHQTGKTLILSHHDFASTPTLRKLQELSSKAADQGADLFKVATFLRDRGDLRRLIEFQTGNAKVPVVAMGMGPAGRFSRLVLGGFGTPLCYGWLGNPLVPGQWPALELRALLDRILPS